MFVSVFIIPYICDDYSHIFSTYVILAWFFSLNLLQHDDDAEGVQKKTYRSMIQTFNMHKR